MDGSGMTARAGTGDAREARWAAVAVALGTGLALADASVVVLALPPMLIDLDTTLEGLAAVIAVYTAVLAAALPFAARLLRRAGERRVGAAGFTLFAVAGALCAVPGSLAPLLVLRALQAAGAAAALVAAFTVLRGGRLWVIAAVAGTAVGPALGGVLTQLLDWRAIFILSLPVGAGAAVACLTATRAIERIAPPGPGVADPHPEAGAAPPPPPRGGGIWGPPDAGAPRRAAGVIGGRAGPYIALGGLSAALSGVLFLLVLLLVSGWSLEPLAAAATVTVLPIAALAGSRAPGTPELRACAGCALAGAGVLALAALPEASVVWVIAPQGLAGAGMGMALPALAGELIPERTPGEAAALLSARHAGITIALLLVAPIAAAQVDDAVTEVRDRGVALVLDARLPPLDKIELAGPLLADLDPVDPRDTLRAALDSAAPRFADDPTKREAFADLRRRADDTLMAAIDDGFRSVFAIAGALALLGAVAVLPRAGRGRAVALAIALAAVALPALHEVARSQLAPERVAIADPCEPRALPDTGGIQGLLQDEALKALDRAACRFGSSREELALALADPASAREYEREYGVDPRSVQGLLGVLGINLG
jgi:MFS family permease